MSIFSEELVNHHDDNKILLPGRSTSSKSVLFVSDMHVGSAYAVCSSDPKVTDTGMFLTPNSLQQQLYQFWNECRDALTQRPYVLCLNGEPIDGANRKQIGQQSWTPNINDQLLEAKKLLKEYTYDNLIITRGSNYHTQSDATNYEEMLANMMDALPYSGLLGKNFDSIKGWHDGHHITTKTDYYVNFEIHGKVFNVTHHVGFSRWFSYQPMAISRELANMEFLKGKYWKPEDFPSIVVRSHVHYYCRVEFPRYTAFTTPAFKMPDAHLFRGGISGTAPSLGTVEVIIEPNGKVLVEPHVITNDKYPKHQILRL